MSAEAPLPPLPALIPIAELRKNTMGEHSAIRRRPAHTPPAIDSCRSRGRSAAPRPERRKSDRRRGGRSKQRGAHDAPSSIAKVNPIFVWIRQEDTRIVDVKCEDYDKRNRILLTKTPHGWRATPRTETLAPRTDKAKHHHHHHHHKKKSKRHRHKIQVDQDPPKHDYPDWESPVNVETLLPSHTISRNLSRPDTPIVISDEVSAQSECKTVSPLETLLSVAELEFNQHVNSEEWSKEKQPFEDVENIIESGDETKYEMVKTVSDYDDDEENNIAMDDILNQLEQSLRSPEEVKEVPIEETKIDEPKETDSVHIIEPPIEIIDLSGEPTEDLEEKPTDLSIKPKIVEEIKDQPTDLSIKKIPKPIRALTPIRPPSQNSEALQSPEPSGLPAVPPSPDLASPKSKSLFLESLLVTSSNERQKEPLDLGKCRKSASPTITCSEEVKDSEPPAKRPKLNESITLKNLLDENDSTKKKSEETPKLLELLQPDNSDPLAQLKHLLSDTTLNVPDPMLVPKDDLSKIISNPAVEIPALLKNRPELRLPEALAFPNLLKDPDILVITLHQLETIIKKQNPNITLKSSNSSSKPEKKKLDKVDKSKTEKIKEIDKNKPSVDLANDIDVATNAAFNPMFWLPYFNQMEANKMFNQGPVIYPAQMSDLSHMLANRFPQQNFPAQHLNYNPLEMNLWQEAMMQANLLRPKFPATENFKDYLDKMSYNMSNKIPQFHQKPMGKNQLFPNIGMPNFAPDSSLMPDLSVYQVKNRAPAYHHLFSQQPKTSEFKMYGTMDNFNPHSSQRTEQGSIRTKPSYKLMPSQKSSGHHQAKAKGVNQPIDLSGSSASGRGRPKQHGGMEPLCIRKTKPSEEIAEVGSTTASIEEMQEAHKHLWHPLFGNEKGYNHNWNWASVSATAE